MAKILVVEDDNNLSEIYQARLTAEGYTVTTANNGEEALALAAREKPDLIISDVMMPKISGFEMLDILRNTQGLNDTKVIVLTALGQAEDKTRADALKADLYLVKSQVTLEDIVKGVKDLLSPDAGVQQPPVSNSDTLTESGTPTPEVTPQPEVPTPPPTQTPLPVTSDPLVQGITPPIPSQPSVAPEVTPQLEVPTPPPTQTVIPTVTTTEPTNSIYDSAPVAHKKIIQPFNDGSSKPDINSLLTTEEAKAISPNTTADTEQQMPLPSSIPQNPTVHQPGNVFTPDSTSTGTDHNDTGIDVNNISL